jgi:recombination protein RecA
MAIKKKRSGTRSRAHEIAAEINSAMGEPVMTVASDPDLRIIKVPTPSLVINRITGGGFALGRHVELYGDPNVGKSTIMYGTMAMSQQRGNLCGLVDPEGVFDAEWFEHLGGFPDELLYSRPNNAEQIIGSLRLLVEKTMEGAPIEIVGIDSQAAMVTKEQVEQDPEKEERVASQARMMSRALRVLTMRNRHILFIWTNQLRSNIGFAAAFTPHVTTAGRAMGFYASTRLEFKKTGAVEESGRRAEKLELKSKKIKVGDWIQVKAMKEKTARPYQQGAYIFRTDRGEIDLMSEILQLGLEDEIITRSGNTFSYETFEGEIISGGEAKFRNILMENEELRDEIVDAISDMTHQIAKVNGDG